MAAIAADSDRMAQHFIFHTSHETYNTASYEVIDPTGRKISLEFADYGGEQISSIEAETSLPEVWATRAREAELWLFFLRIDRLLSSKSFLTEPVETGQPMTELLSQPRGDSSWKRTSDDRNLPAVALCSWSVTQHKDFDSSSRCITFMLG